MIKITAPPHTGGPEFVTRYGPDAIMVVTAVGRELDLGGVNARVVRPGTIAVGDVGRKLADA